jgi:hypothetical protein
MKREAFSHTKMQRLCRKLDLPLWQAVGLLETLWNLTAKQAIGGDIGRLSNEDIAMAIDYRGDEGYLIQTLVSIGWLDTHPVHRLVIHDWADHAPDAVHMKLARLKKNFACGAAPKTNRLPKWEREEADKFFGLPETHKIYNMRTDSESVRTDSESVRTKQQSVSVPSPDPPSTYTSTLPRPSPDPPISASLSTQERASTNTRVHAAVPNGQLTEWLRPWPRVPNPDAVARAWVSIGIQSEDEPEVFACRDRYLASEEVSRNVVMDPAKFLFQQSQTHWGGKWPHRTTGTNKKLTPTEEAIAEAKARRTK